MTRALAKTVCIAVIGGLLVWLVITTSFAAYLSRINPAAALRLQPGNPVAAVALTDAWLQAGRADAARAMAEAALRSHPLDADALSRLGQIYDASGDRASAAVFMAAAARQSLHDSIAVHWMMQKHLHERDFPTALQWADALMRTRPDVIDGIAPQLGGIAQDAAARPFLIALLATNPPWRAAFLARLCLALSDARTMLDILLDLETASAPLSRAEVNVYLDVLLAQGLAKFAYYAWLQLLPSDRLKGAGLLFNGTFSERPSGAPFDWRISSGLGAISEIIAHSDQPALGVLRISLGPGRIELGDVAQIVVLPAARYRLRGSANVQLTGRRGLQWRVACSDGTVIGASSPIVDTGQDWARFDAIFDVPVTQCPFQIVQLGLDPSRPSEKLISGTAFYTEMQIVRDPAP